MRIAKFISILMMGLLVSGCGVFFEKEADPEDHRNQCLVAGTTGAAALGSIASPLGAGVSMVVGGVLSHFICPDVAQPAMAPKEEDTSGFFHPDDQDLDRVTDNNDMCPFTPEGITVDADGCALDDDEDGVPNYMDQCLATPKGNVVDTDGCSLKIVSLEGVHFAFDSSRLTSEAKSILDSAAVKLNAHSGSRFTIEGHTDSYGSDVYNQQLSERRAKAVMNYLISQGVAASRLVAVGKGESFPIASNDSREGRAENRRVDVFAK